MTDSLPNTFAERMLYAMDQSGKKQKLIADEMGVTPQSVTRWRKDGYLAKEKIPMFCRVCGVSIEWLLTGEASTNSQLEELMMLIDKLPDEQLGAVVTMLRALSAR